MNQRIKGLATRVANMSLPARLFSSLGIALLGSLSVGTLSEYAGYYYAVTEGFRPPFEGVPYLRPTVSIVAFLFLIGLAAVVSILYVFASTPVRLVERESENDPSEIATRILSKDGKVPPVLRLSLMAFNVFFYRKFMGVDLREARRLHKAGKHKEALISMGTSMREAYIYRPAAPYLIAGIGGIVFILTSIGYLFDPPSYRKLLCSMRYGGGHPVVVELVAPDAKKVMAYEGGLAIRTSSVVMLEVRDAFVEIPLQHVGSIRYPEWPRCF